MSFGTKKKSWSENDLRVAVKNSTSIRQVLQHLGLREAGGNYEQIKKYISYYKIDTNHFTGRAWSKGKKGIGRPRLTLKEILTTDSYFQSFKLKNRLFKEGLKEAKCEICGWAKRSTDGRIPVELDHINGIKTDNRIENLRILCPNCHSLQTTHRGLNRK